MEEFKEGNTSYIQPSKVPEIFNKYHKKQAQTRACASFQ
jgi:dsDNA-specific endonuclease/ATPase MutS2